MFDDMKEKYGRDLNSLGIRTPSKSNIKRRLIADSEHLKKIEAVKEAKEIKIAPKTEVCKSFNLKPLLGLVVLCNP